MPADTPVTRPFVPTVATAVLDDAQAPPATALENGVDAPTQTDAALLIIPASGSVLTVTSIVVATGPQLLLTV